MYLLAGTAVTYLIIDLKSTANGELQLCSIAYVADIIIRRPASALLDKLLCPPGPGGPAAAG